MKTKYWILLVLVLAGAAFYFFEDGRAAKAAQAVKEAQTAEQSAKADSAKAYQVAQVAMDAAEKRISELRADSSAKDAHIAALQARRASVESKVQAEVAKIPSMDNAALAKNTLTQLGADTGVAPTSDGVLFDAPRAKLNLQMLSLGATAAQTVVFQDQQIGELNGKISNAGESAKQIATEREADRSYFTANQKYWLSQVGEREAEIRQFKAQRWKSRLRWFAIGGTTVAILIATKH